MIVEPRLNLVGYGKDVDKELTRLDCGGGCGKLGYILADIYSDSQMGLGCGIWDLVEA